MDGRGAAQWLSRREPEAVGGRGSRRAGGWIFARFIEIGSCTILAREVEAKGLRTSRGNWIDKKYLYRMLSNRAYIGEAVHKGES